MSCTDYGSHWLAAPSNATTEATVAFRRRRIHRPTGPDCILPPGRLCRKRGKINGLPVTLSLPCRDRTINHHSRLELAEGGKLKGAVHA
jgi:hypothetical protein